MTAHLTEEEQLETLKRWWNENGKSTVVGVVIAVGAYFGWQGWQNNQSYQAEMASSHYQNVLEALTLNPGQALSESKRATVVHLSETLKSDHASTLYASQAALFIAKLAVEEGDLAKAESELRWVLDQNADSDLTKVVAHRLARVLLAQEQYTEALSLVSDDNAGAFSSLYAETRGDIFMAQGNSDSARAAYQLSQQNLTQSDEARAPLLAMKLDQLQIPDVSLDADLETVSATVGEQQ